MRWRVARAAALVTATGLWLSPGVAQAQCRPGDLLVGEDADNYYCRSRAEYQGSTAEKAGARFCTAKRTLAADQNAIRELGFAADAERFETFAEVAKEQRAELQRKALDALLDQGLDAGGLIADSAKSLNPWNVNNAVKMLEDRGFKNRTVVAALRRIAGAKDKPAMASAYHQFAEVAKGAKEGWNTGTAAASDEKNAEMQLLLGALKILQGNPELGLVVTGVEFSESLAYLVYLNGQVDALGRSTDDKLTRVGALGRRLRDHVEALRGSRSQWRQAMGIRTGEPRCGS